MMDDTQSHDSTETTTDNAGNGVELHTATLRVEFMFDETLERETGGMVMTDRYRITSREPDTGIKHEREVNNVRIGCPECKANAKARLENGEYICACGYQSELSTDKLLYDGLEQRETWEPY